jgi:hypothetical protein
LKFDFEGGFGVFRQSDGRRFAKCGNKLLLNCLPALLVPIYREMYIKISNVSTNPQLSEAIS